MPNVRPDPSVHRIPGLVLREHRLSVPLDHDQPRGETIEVFAREVVAPEREHADLPWLVFLQGGPGYPSPRPMDASGWIGKAIEQYRVLLLDQRGTGLSTPVTFETLAGMSASAQADYLAHFRADAIVRDAEVFRERVAGGKPWTVLGQSFGGFCAVHYLSRFPEALAGALITGGLPSLEATAEDVYRRTYGLVAERNHQYYARYPGDVERARAIVDLLDKEEVRLPSGDRLTARRFQQLGLHFGFSDGFEVVHYLLEQAFVPGRKELSYSFLRGFEGALSFDTNPFFTLLHEACYAQGVATDWAAERVRAEHPEFVTDGEGPVFFTGEMVYPWMFRELRTLEPLREAAELLAARTDWPKLYDAEQLARNEVPCAAAIYAQDMYVERSFSEETAARIRGLRVWLTNEYEHNGLRADGALVLGRLLDLMHGSR